MTTKTASQATGWKLNPVTMNARTTAVQWISTTGMAPERFITRLPLRKCICVSPEGVWRRNLTRRTLPLLPRNPVRESPRSVADDQSKILVSFFALRNQPINAGRDSMTRTASITCPLLRKSVGQVSNLPTRLWSFTWATHQPLGRLETCPTLFHRFRASHREMKAPQSELPITVYLTAPRQPTPCAPRRSNRPAIFDATFAPIRLGCAKLNHYSFT